MYNCKKYFEKYVSNTLSGSATQSFFISDGSVKKSRVYYKLFAGGSYEYSLLYSNITDSTFADGSVSVCNMELGEWKIHSLRVGIVKACDMENATTPEAFTQVCFSGKREKNVEKGELFYSDPFVIKADKGEYLCVETEFSGKQIPCHKEFWSASFIEEGGSFVPSTDIPVPSMIGCDRKVNLKIAYLGDSITQGIGSTKNSYLHWNARLSEMLGEENAYWNLGIGYARSTDAASDGAWMYKAMQNDLIFVCLGVNDMGRKTASEIIHSLEKIVDILKKAGKKVIIQSVPPFDYTEETLEKWLEINNYIENELSKKADGYFDNVKVLGKNETEPQIAKFGGHPDDEGCLAWANALYAYVKNKL